MTSPGYSPTPRPPDTGHRGDTDRWTIAVCLAPAARRCGAAITASGPYAEVPELLALADRAGEMQRAAAFHLPMPTALRGIDILIGASFKIGRRVMCRHTDIDTWIEQQVSEAHDRFVSDAEPHSHDTDFGRFPGLRWVDPLAAG